MGEGRKANEGFAPENNMVSLFPGNRAVSTMKLSNTK